MFESILLAVVLATGPSDQVAVAPMPFQATLRAAVIPGQWQRFAECVANRESHHNPHALNKSSGAAGRYQFLPAWRHGLPYMVAERMVAHGYPKAKAKRIVRILQSVPINKWKAHYQDIGFIAAITSTEGMGWKHWYLAGSPCNSLVPGGRG